MSTSSSNTPNKFNFEKVFKVFKKNYKLVPLEIFTTPYTCLVSTVMSARTRDDVTVIVAKNLFKKAPNIKALSKMSEKEIEKIIHSISFGKTKAKHLKALAEIVVKDYKGKIPNHVDELVKLPGVGKKTANLVVNRVFETPAIAVDTHVHKITNLLGWVKTKTPEETEKELVKILPKKYWKDTNRFFVSIGQQYKTKKKVIYFLMEKELL